MLRRQHLISAMSQSADHTAAGFAASCVPQADGALQQIIAYNLLLSTTKVCCLKLGNLLIIQRYGSTPVRLFANKVVLRGGLMTTQARQPLRVIDDVFASFADLGSSRGNI